MTKSRPAQGSVCRELGQPWHGRKPDQQDFTVTPHHQVVEELGCGKNARTHRLGLKKVEAGKRPPVVLPG